MRLHLEEEFALGIYSVFYSCFISERSFLVDSLGNRKNLNLKLKYVLICDVLVVIIFLMYWSHVYARLNVTEKSSDHECQD
jgi:hypothetical protein